MENYNQKLETLLSKFGEIINDKCATGPYLPLEYDKYFCCAYKNIKDLNVDIESINLLTSNPRLYEMIDNPIKNQRAGLLLSALIDKAVKKGEKIQIKTLMPINCLFYKLENLEAHVNMAGDDLGSRAKNSKIFADKTGHSAGSYMDNCELHVREAVSYLGNKAKNSKIYADKTVDCTGRGIDNCELHVREACNDLGSRAKNSRIYADKTGHSAGSYMDNCELHVREAGNNLGTYTSNSKIYADKTGHSAGSYMDNCELQVNIAGDYLGHGAKNSKIYAAYEAGNNAGKKMKNSQLFIDKLDGKLKGNLRIKNRIYLGKESYEHHPVIYRLTRVKILEK